MLIINNHINNLEFFFIFLDCEKTSNLSEDFDDIDKDPSFKATERDERNSYSGKNINYKL